MAVSREWRIGAGASDVGPSRGDDGAANGGWSATGAVSVVPESEDGEEYELFEL
jgi:hypothetical protein